MVEHFSWDSLVRRRIGDYRPPWRMFPQAADSDPLGAVHGRQDSHATPLPLHESRRGQPRRSVEVQGEDGQLLRVGATSLLASSRSCTRAPGAVLQIGARSFVGLGLMSIAERVEIGDDVMISWGVTIVDHNSHSLVARERIADVELWLRGAKQWTGIKIAPVQIGNRAWLGFNVAVCLVSRSARVRLSVPARSSREASRHGPLWSATPRGCCANWPTMSALDSEPAPASEGDAHFQSREAL